MNSDSESTTGDDARNYLSHSNELWVRRQFEWLISTFGIKKLWEAPFLTLCERDFPDPYARTEADAELLFSRICGYMELDVNRLKLRFYSRDDPIEVELAGIPSNAAGLYQCDLEKPTVWLDRALLDNPEFLIAVIAHELCHEILLGQKHLDQAKDKDHERVTDLLTIFLGMGVFTGNVYLPRKRWFQDSLETSNRRKLGYLSLGALGYSLALMAWHRNEAQPEWRKELNPKLRQLVERNIDRLWNSRGSPSIIPSTLVSQLANSIRRIPTDALVRPEIVVSDYQTDQYAAVVNCLCPGCKEWQQFSVEFAGQTATCPSCQGFLDVPELVGGRRETLVSQWNARKRSKQNDLNWQRYNLPAKWRVYFVCLIFPICVPFLMLNRGDLTGEVFLAYAIGVGLGVGVTNWWRHLKDLEQDSRERYRPSKQ